MFLELKNTTFQSITGKIYDFVTPLVIVWFNYDNHIYPANF